MNKIRTIYFVLAIIFTSILAILIVLPEVIPSFEKAQVISLGVVYMINIALAYMIIVRLRQYLQNMFDKTRTSVLSTIVMVIFALVLTATFIINSFGIGQGYGKYYKDLKFHQPRVTIYLYDDSSVNPLTTIKIKDETWPVMENLAFIENCNPSNLVISQKSDTLILSSQDIILKINLKKRNAVKTYVKQHLN